MSEDRIQRQIEFIIEQQAKFTTDIAELKEGMVELKESQQRTTEHISNLADAVLSLTNIVEKQGDQIAALAAQGKETDARLNTLIDIVERHITSAKAHEGEEG
jgi:chromosome segregation ATPase